MMLEIDSKTREIEGITLQDLPDALPSSNEPFILRGLVRDWPFVKAGKVSGQSARDYMLKFYDGAVVAASVGDPKLNGRIFYNEDMTGPNVRVLRKPLEEVFAKFAEFEEREDPPLIYIGSTTIDTCLPGFRGENDVALGNRDALASIWIGSESRIAAHNDLPENLACVAVGRRRFTLFPPEQIANLYIGPLDVTPAGRSVSLVDFHDPDFEQFPKFREALKVAQIAELDAGDALYIPPMWWHHVEGLDRFNVLVNYWWREAPEYMGSPQTVLNHAILALRDLPPEAKKVWKQMFDHYVFENEEDMARHIPEAARGILGPVTDQTARRIRAFLLNKLNR